MSEHPGLIEPGEFDLVGFAVGVVERAKVLPQRRARRRPHRRVREPGSALQRLLARPRRAARPRRPRARRPRVAGAHHDLAEELLRPSVIYAPAMLRMVHEADMHAFAHVTGGGIPGNLVRVLPDRCDAVVSNGSWEVPRIFREIQHAGAVDAGEMEHVFNLGLGMLAVVAADDALTAVDVARAAGHDAWLVGEIVDGHGRVQMSAGWLMQFRIARFSGFRAPLRGRCVARGAGAARAASMPRRPRRSRDGRCRARRSARCSADQGAVGLAASRTTACWAHNDSGDAAHLRDRSVARCDRRLTPRPSTGRTSRSTARRSTSVTSATTTRPAVIVVYRVANRADREVGERDEFTLHYPDGPHDAEALMVDPLKRQLVIVTKEAATRRCTSPRSTTRARCSGQDARSARAVGHGGRHLANGDMVALRTYAKRLWERRAASPRDALARRRAAPGRGRAQSEALALAPADATTPGARVRAVGRRRWVICRVCQGMRRLYTGRTGLSV